MKKIAIFSLLAFFFACVKEAEEQINIYTIGNLEANVSAEKSIGGKKSASWVASGQALIDKKEKSPKYLTLQMGTVSEDGFPRESVDIMLPIKSGAYTLNSTLSFKEPFATYGIWASDGHVLDASYDCDITKSSIKVSAIDTIANTMSGEFELYFNTFNPNNSYPKIASFKKGKFDVKIKRF